MNGRQFYDLVVEMRQAQKDYFAARKSGHPKEEFSYLLGKSKSLEQRVDAEISRVNAILDKKNGKKDYH